MKKQTLLIISILLLTFSAISAQETPKTISGGVVNGKATSLPKPAYPAAAKAVGAEGRVDVNVLIDETGKVISATAVSGHPLLRYPAAEAARRAKFAPTKLAGQPVKVSGVITYIFASPLDWKNVGVALGDAEKEIEYTYGLKTASYSLLNEFQEEGNSIEKVVDNFEKNVENPTSQSAAIGQIITSLKSKLIARPDDLRNFEIGLAIGRITANLCNDSILLDNLSELIRLYKTAPGKIDEDTTNIDTLSAISNKIKLSRRDKDQIEQIVQQLKRD